ncbi:hypothetical protein Taro_052121 [Colocasia esculenta]|uniref:Uncharacterized protein n=1 Tax=Colocasia esculenta TaxID=4460 RepID=A0A843XIT2_COLES|nr:hypothetical protein [Colocasia esculenta]
MCDDTSIINAYLATSNIIKGVEDHIDFDHSVIGSEGIVEVEKDTLSVSCSSSSITLMKRVAVNTLKQPNSSEDLTLAQMSCNKKKQIKIEKKMTLKVLKNEFYCSRFRPFQKHFQCDILDCC